MRSLRLETFIKNFKDYESGQYRILAGLKNARNQFAHDRLYPTLAELISLYQNLTDILRAGDDLRRELPKRIVGLDLKSQRVLHEAFTMSREELNAVEELTRWALPKIRETIEEGRTIYNFIEEHVAIEEVGLLPSYVDEGYLLVPDTQSGMIHLVGYEVSIFSSADQKFRNLKTRRIKSLPLTGLDSTAWHIKQKLINELADLPNPATYAFTTEFDYPYTETLLPMAKRKLLSKLYS
ncbi:MAG: hypothetical protein J4G05_04005 [Chlorobi bacterium]|nr:hypothetical protein [Chlorobiota bacterium]